jgi:hypothetical protein
VSLLLINPLNTQLAASEAKTQAPPGKATHEALARRHVMVGLLKAASYYVSPGVAQIHATLSEKLTKTLYF